MVASPTITVSVKDTAKLVAAKRAIEQLHEFPLFFDPYSAILAGEETQKLLNSWQAIAKEQGIPARDVITKRTRYISVRTKHIDDQIMAFMASLHPHAPAQVVILGAGLDTRAYRLNWPTGTTVWEVDYAEPLKVKQSTLNSTFVRCDQQFIFGDLTSQGWRRELTEGVQAAPIIWVLEGLIMYLRDHEVRDLLSWTAELSPPGSTILLDGVSKESQAAGQRARQSDHGNVVQQWNFGCNNPEDLLVECGWSQVSSVHPSQVYGGYGRYPEHLPVGQDVGGASSERRTWIATAKK